MQRKSHFSNGNTYHLEKYHFNKNQCYLARHEGGVEFLKRQSYQEVTNLTAKYIFIRLLGSSEVDC